MKMNRINAEKKSPLSIIACVFGKHRTGKVNTSILIEDTKEDIKEDIKEYFTEYFNCKAASDNSIEVPHKADIIVSNTGHVISSESEPVEEYYDHKKTNQTDTINNQGITKSSEVMHHAKETKEIKETNQNKSKKMFKPDAVLNEGMKKQNDEIIGPYLQVVLISTDEHEGFSMSDSDKCLNNNQNHPDTSVKEVKDISPDSNNEPKVIEIPSQILTNFLSILNPSNGSIPLDSFIKVTTAHSEPIN